MRTLANSSNSPNKIDRALERENGEGAMEKKQTTGYGQKRMNTKSLKISVVIGRIAVYIQWKLCSCKEIHEHLKVCYCVAKAVEEFLNITASQFWRISNAYN